MNPEQTRSYAIDQAARIVAGPDHLIRTAQQIEEFIVGSTASKTIDILTKEVADLVAENNALKEENSALKDVAASQTRTAPCPDTNGLADMLDQFAEREAFAMGLYDSRNQQGREGQIGYVDGIKRAAWRLRTPD